MKELSLSLWNSLLHGRNQARRNDYSTAVMHAVCSSRGWCPKLNAVSPPLTSAAAVVDSSMPADGFLCRSSLRRESCDRPEDQPSTRGGCKFVDKCPILPSFRRTILRCVLRSASESPLEIEPQVSTAILNSIMYLYWLFLLPRLTFPTPSLLLPKIISQINSLHPSFCFRLCF